jgi:hypothetical protein
MDHNFADTGQHDHDHAKAQHMTNDELNEARNDGRLFVQTFQGPKKVETIIFHGEGRYSTATVWVENSGPLNTQQEIKAERADFLVQTKNGDTLQ